MASFAFVIGIDTYDDHSMPNLETPVDDAMRMVAWLVERGGVPPSNLVVLVNPVPGGPPDFDAREARILPMLADLGKPAGWFAGVLGQVARFGNLYPAKKDNILAVLAGFPDQTSGGERLYFYYSGHGLMGRIAFGNEDAIVSADYRKDVRKPIGISSVARFFQPLNFPEQFFFLDCCRNAPVDDRALDMAPAPSQVDLSRPAADQFIFNATAPGQKALDGRGLLTDLLLDGLLGKGRAKEWDPGLGVYAVKVDRLFAYIRARFTAGTQLPVLAKVAGKIVIQQPRLGGEHTQDPALNTFPNPTFPDVQLSLTVSPASSQVILMGIGFNQTFNGLPTPTHVISLRPRTYMLAANPGEGWHPPSATHSVELFDEDAWTVTFTPIAPVPVPTPPADVGGSVSFAPIKREAGPSVAAPSAGDVVALRPDDPAWPGRISAKVDDPLARVVLELVQADQPDASGGPADFPRQGFGGLEASKLAPGFYRASVRSPGRMGEQRTLHLSEGQAITMTLASSDPGSTATILPADPASKKSGMEPPVSFGVGPSRGVGSSSKRNEASRGSDDGLIEAQVGLLLEGILAPRSQFDVYLAAEMAEGAIAMDQAVATRLDSPARVAAYLAGVRVRFWPIDGDAGVARPATPTARAGIVRFSQEAEPGLYWMRAELAPAPDVPDGAGRGTDCVIAILDGRSTVLSIFQDSQGRISAALFFPSRDPTAPTSPDLIRRLDRAQRYLFHGQTLEAIALLQGDWDVERPDPIVGCLAGHLLLRARRFDDLGTLAGKMVELYPGLPDSHVLLGFHQLAAGGRDEQAARLFGEALDRGLPISAHLLTSLAADLARSGLRHARIPLLLRVSAGLVAGSPWTAWGGDPA